MEVTIVKKLNGIELHAAHDDMEAKMYATYIVEIPELGISDRKALNLRTVLTPIQVEKVEQLIQLVERKI